MPVIGGKLGLEGSSMIDANSPRSRIVFPERTRTKIHARWLEWSAALKIEQQARPSHLCFDETWHQGWLIYLLRRGVEMRVVRRLELDDPRKPLTELHRRVEKYILRRNGRKSYGKGKVLR
jgi:hypothetical protein